jgi:hypothetical protein
MLATEGIKIEGNKVIIKDELTKTAYRVDFDYLVDIIRTKVAKNKLEPTIEKQKGIQWYD